MMAARIDDDGQARRPLATTVVARCGTWLEAACRTGLVRHALRGQVLRLNGNGLEGAGLMQRIDRGLHATADTITAEVRLQGALAISGQRALACCRVAWFTRCYVPLGVIMI